MSFFFHEMDIGNLLWTKDIGEARPAFRESVRSSRSRDDADITHIDDHLVVHEAFRLEQRARNVASIGERLWVPLDPAHPLHMKNVGRQRMGFPARELFYDHTVDSVRGASACVFEGYGYLPDLADADLDLRSAADVPVGGADRRFDLWERVIRG